MCSHSQKTGTDHGVLAQEVYQREDSDYLTCTGNTVLLVQRQKASITVILTDPKKKRKKKKTD